MHCMSPRRLDLGVYDYPDNGYSHRLVLIGKIGIAVGEDYHHIRQVFAFKPLKIPENCLEVRAASADRLGAVELPEELTKRSAPFGKIKKSGTARK